MAIIIYPEKRNLLRAAPRLMQILRVLARHKFFGALAGKRHWPQPIEVRETFEELGLTFLKFGQVLALRRDLLPDAYIDELELLHDQLPAMSMHTVRTRIEFELGTPLTKIFSAFSETPLAAATIAQVHEATLQDGRHVAVKVQRPGLKRMISKDITALTCLVELGEIVDELGVGVLGWGYDLGDGHSKGSILRRADSLRPSVVTPRDEMSDISAGDRYS